MNKMKACKTCTAPKTTAILFTYVHLCLGITLLFIVKVCFYLLNFGYLFLVLQMSVNTVNRRWWKLRIFCNLQHQNVVITIFPKAHFFAQYIKGVCFNLSTFGLWQSSANHSILNSTPPTVSIHFVLSEAHQEASECNHIKIDFHGWEKNNGNFFNVENVCVPFG